MTDPHARDCGIRTRGHCDCGYLDFVSAYTQQRLETCGGCRFAIRHLVRPASNAPPARGYCIMQSCRVGHSTPACERFQPSRRATVWDKT